ncbi:MAG: DNA cytosine methyltransferase [Cytophagia bacterium]|nr:DNA cytosine methyltransferase [Cytophagia bacterium]
MNDRIGLLESNVPSVIDFFCGAGGFSEGFRQEGFNIIRGFDHWSPAVDTFNFNFKMNEKPFDILQFWDNVDLIESIPDSEIIIGSPPCISFSNSNRSGKADKSLGLKLTEVFLRIIAVKKFKKGSILEAWYMENVTNSLNYLARSYKFRDLNLFNWAKDNGYSPDKVVITIEGNSAIINSAEYGSPQARKRAITGEIIGLNKFIVPPKSHSIKPGRKLPMAKTLGSIKSKLPKPNVKKSSRRIIDPSNPCLSIPLSHLTDHFYDTGLYESQWRNSYFMKKNHPYMGRMSFPENQEKPSRTLTATNIGTSREAIIYKSEYNRKGNGEYRVPTVREMACLMGFPITYQFIANSETSKCRLVGNAVCISVSRALARTVKKSLQIDQIKIPAFIDKVNLKLVPNLNTYSEKIFDKPPVKKPGSRFRRHPFKYGNITVTLSNYDITNDSLTDKWMTSVQYGNGEGYPSKNYEDGFYNVIEPIILSFEGGEKFVKFINNGFSEKIAKSEKFQKMYELQKSDSVFLEPTRLIEEVAKEIDKFKFDSPSLKQTGTLVFDKKKIVPKKQIMALYAINKIASITNSTDNE